MDFSNQDVGIRPLSAEEIARSPYYMSNFRANSSNFPRKPKIFLKKAKKSRPAEEIPEKRGLRLGGFSKKGGRQREGISRPRRCVGGGWLVQGKVVSFLNSFAVPAFQNRITLLFQN